VIFAGVKGQVEADGKVTVRDLATGRLVRLWPVDAAEAFEVGSHAWPTPDAPAAPTADVPSVPSNLEELKAGELLALAQARGLDVPKGAKKAELVAALQALPPAPPSDPAAAG
jgi:hypothetical protein